MRFTLLAIPVALGLLAAPAAMAAPTIFTSHAGNTDGQACFNGNTAATCTQITPHSAWMQGANAFLFGDLNNNDAATMPNPVWISYANTGIGGTLATPVGQTALDVPVLRVTQTFTLASLSLASLRQWADDTVETLIDGIVYSSPNFSQNTCADGSPGCEPGESSFFEVVLGAGEHTFEWRVWQVGTGGNANDNPMGLLYIGQVAEIPAPATLLLLAPALLGLGALRRRTA